MSKRVDIEKTQCESIKFPAVCPVCGRENPDSQINMRTYINVNQPLNEGVGDHWNLDVPVCEKHKKNIVFGRLFSGLIFFMLLAIMSTALVFLLPALGGQGWLVFAVTLIALISLVIFAHAKIYTAPLLLESFSYRLLFTFKSDKLAEKFARLNGIEKMHTSMNQSIKVPPETD